MLTLVEQPHYLILIDEKYQALFTNKAYFAQDQIQVVSNSQVKKAKLISYVWLSLYW